MNLTTAKRSRAATALVGLTMAGAGLVGWAAPAGAASVFDGTWTVSHGGSGQLVLQPDGTYTSTCSVRAGYAATCPDPTGTFARGYGGSSSYVFFTGDAGNTVSFRWAGDVSQPSSMASGGLSGMIIDRGTSFVCSAFWENGYQLAKTPLVHVGANDDIFAVGSNQDLGPRTADNWVSLAETGPNYFVEGDCATGGSGGGGGAGSTSPVVHVGDIDGSARRTNGGRRWQATAKVYVVNAAGQPVSGATVQGTWSGQGVSCVTGTDGSCTLSSPSYQTGITAATFTVSNVTATGATYDRSANADPDGSSNGTTLTVQRP